MSRYEKVMYVGLAIAVFDVEKRQITISVTDELFNHPLFFSLVDKKKMLEMALYTAKS